MEERRFLLMPPRILWLQLAVSAAMHWGVGLSYPVGQSTVAGAVLIVIGVGINVWASRIFGRERTPIRPGTTPRTVVGRGPFRWSRNPMYVGLIALHLGVALFVGGAAFWVSAAVYAAILRVLFIPHEERVLRAAFGEAYDAYTSRVFRWVGRQTETPRHQEIRQSRGQKTSCP